MTRVEINKDKLAGERLVGSQSSPIKNVNSPQEPQLHSLREKEKGRKVTEKVVASRIGENRLPDEDTNINEQSKRNGGSGLKILQATILNEKNQDNFIKLLQEGI